MLIGGYIVTFPGLPNIRLIFCQEVFRLLIKSNLRHLQFRDRYTHPDPFFCILIISYLFIIVSSKIVSRNSKRKINHNTKVVKLWIENSPNFPSLFIYLEGHCIQMAKGMCIESPATFHPKCALWHTNDLRSVRLQIRGTSQGVCKN